MVDHESDHICSLQLLTVSTQRYPNISFYYLYNIGKIYYLATNGLKTQINQLIFIGIYIMNKIMSSISAILFIFILFFPHQSLAHDGDNIQKMSMAHQIHILNHMKKEVALNLILKSMGTTNGKTLTKITNTRPSIQKRVVEQ